MEYAVAFACAALTGLGLLQAAAGWLALRRFQRVGPAAPPHCPPVSVLKPLHGDEALLEAALASVCAQDYPAFQLVFGVQDPNDAALPVLRRLRARFPRLDMAVVVDPTPHGSNRKVANLINMLPAARHELLVIADSDVHAAPDALRRLTAALQRPGIGLVTAPYTGRAGSDSLAARLGAAWINQTFLPGALLGRALGRQDCLGATMALTRTTLARIGGFAALADEIADDAALGQLVRAQGLGVGMADTVPATTIPETQLADLFEHELRWARTVRATAPVGFALSVVQYPLFWAVLTVGLAGGAAWAWALFAAAWLLRAAIGAALERGLRLGAALPIWWLPLRDLLSVTVMLASYGSNRVQWRGQVHRVTRPGFSRTGLAPGEG